MRYGRLLPLWCSYIVASAVSAGLATTCTAQSAAGKHIGTAVMEQVLRETARVGDLHQDSSSPNWLKYVFCDGQSPTTAVTEKEAPATDGSPVPEEIGTVHTVPMITGNPSIPAPNYTFAFLNRMTYKRDYYLTTFDNNGNCTPGNTSFIINSQPQYGRVTQKVLQYPNPPGCNATVPDTYMYYTWTDDTTQPSGNSPLIDVWTDTWTFTDSRGNPAGSISETCHAVKAPYLKALPATYAAKGKWSPKWVWWFGNDANGSPYESASVNGYWNFNTFIAFPQRSQALYSPQLATTWNIVRGADLADFLDSQGDQQISPYAPPSGSGQYQLSEVYVQGIGASPVADTTHASVQVTATIQCAIPGAPGCDQIGSIQSDPLNMGVRTAFILSHYSANTSGCITPTGAEAGWLCKPTYEIVDQYKSALFGAMEESETFDGAGGCAGKIQSNQLLYPGCVVYSGSNWWIKSAAGPCYNSNNGISFGSTCGSSVVVDNSGTAIATFVDVFSFYQTTGMLSSFVPEFENGLSYSDLVVTQKGSFYLGGTTSPGTGVKVETHIWQSHQGYGDHGKINSPATTY